MFYYLTIHFLSEQLNYVYTRIFLQLNLIYIHHFFYQKTLKYFYLHKTSILYLFKNASMTQIKYSYIHRPKYFRWYIDLYVQAVKSFDSLVLVHPILYVPLSFFHFMSSILIRFCLSLIRPFISLFLYGFQPTRLSLL